MTKTQITAALAEMGLQEDVYLRQHKLWEIMASICLQSTFHIYLDIFHDYKFNSVNGQLEIYSIDKDDNRRLKRLVDYENIVCFNCTDYMYMGTPIKKGFR